MVNQLTSAPPQPAAARSGPAVRLRNPNVVRSDHGPIYRSMGVTGGPGKTISREANSTAARRQAGARPQALWVASAQYGGWWRCFCVNKSRLFPIFSINIVYN